MPVNIDFEKIANEMKTSISAYKIRLKNDFSGDGWSKKEGQYGDLKGLSKKIMEIGGPDFFPSENEQYENIKI